MHDTSLFEKAVAFASDAHSGDVRRGKNIPYLLHPLEAAVIVSSVSEDPELIAAAVLHDVVEDTPITLEMIKDKFGSRIAEIVDINTDRYPASDAGLSAHDSWHIRKEDCLKRLLSAPRDAKIVALGDKLSNMRAISRDAVRGDIFWSSFKAGSREALGWYYLGLADALSDLSDLEPWKEFSALTAKLFG